MMAYNLKKQGPMTNESEKNVLCKHCTNEFTGEQRKCQAERAATKKEKSSNTVNFID